MIGQEPEVLKIFNWCYLIIISTHKNNQLYWSNQVLPYCQNGNDVQKDTGDFFFTTILLIISKLHSELFLL